MIPKPAALAAALLLALVPTPPVGPSVRRSVSPSARQSVIPSVLIVIAHPDDDAMFTGSVYKITHTLNGSVDLALITDGSGGFRYSQLAEPIYHLRLTDERVARQYLPAIRKRELMNGGAIEGIRNYFFLDELDHGYTENVDTVLRSVWHTDQVRTRLEEIMRRGRYDYVFVHLPIPNFHAHHKAATILALEAAQALPTDQRPVVLGCFVGTRSDTTLLGFRELPGYPITRVRADVAPFVFDRLEPLAPDRRINYRVVANWVIAEHKTQGAMQLLVNDGEIERFWYFAADDSTRLAATRAFFDRLAQPALGAR